MEPIVYILIGTIGFMYLFGGIETLYAAEFGENDSKSIMILSRVLEYTFFLPITVFLILIGLIIVIAEVLIYRARKKS